ncbi:phosphoribosyltransferase [Flavobacterium akiainvivens]|uniref:Phosphoribosyltransferase n=1 Tax=Flavobacterium akiainvivens TaxID=1202724 RepID=A0A0M8MC30_9FLAO|nr:phosphoribosyltransferase family protein [Flavobacterium akiainvivens]KOS08063.1 phosphoribosyltransferase [Flavobacterium akiainvivens]SFQ62466.1 pyrimidine operon attenuation protein / uracil phosphoribosyltransferase [Flavobacterium akiainvivens]
MKHIILTKEEIQHKIRRIAYQIYETFPDEEEVVVAGIASNGFEFAKLLAAELGRISDIKPVICEVKINKNEPQEAVQTSLTPEEYTNKALVLADDVLNSGTTLIYGVKHFLNVPLKKFKTAVLVDRNHKQYPVKADFKGLSLSTSLKEHIEVVLVGSEPYAALN